MTYHDHLSRLIDAILAAVPGLSARKLSERAGLHPGWVGDFRSHGRATLTSADAVIALCRDLCPMGPAGDGVRGLLCALDAEERGGVDGAEPQDDAA